MIPQPLHPRSADVETHTVAPDGRPRHEQPKWRRDFPIDWSQDDYVSRRELVKFMVLTSAAFVAGQAWLVWKRLFERRDAGPPALAIAAVDELPVGGARTFTYPPGSPPRLLIRTGPAAFVAYDQQCTHLLCPVVPAVDQGRLHCPCHNGWFDLATGRPLAGPPRRPLPRVIVEVRGREVYATGVEVSSA
ncbi:MAG TPA: Rieske (2Fe-2S) protein [Methylomirabilota bacterium]